MKIISFDLLHFKNVDFMTISQLAKEKTGNFKDYEGLLEWLLECVDDPDVFVLPVSGMPQMPEPEGRRKHPGLKAIPGCGTLSVKAKKGGAAVCIIIPENAPGCGRQS